MKKFRFNVRLFAILCISAIVIGVSFYAVHRLQANRPTDIYLERARRYCEQAENEEDSVRRYKLAYKGAVAYQKYLRSHPDIDIQFEEASFLIDQGKWILENGATADAVALISMSRGILERALRQTEDRKDIRKKFVNILFSFGDFSTATQHIRFLCDFPEDHAALQKLFDRYDLWGKAIAEGKVEVGADKSRDLSPFLNSDKKDVDQNKLLKFLGDDIWMIMEDPDLLSILGRCQLYSNNAKPAIQTLKKSVDLSPDNLDAYNALVNALRLQDLGEDAVVWLEKAVQANPDSFRSYLMRGQGHLYHTRAVSEEKAIEVLAIAEWDALQAAQKATQQLIESAEQIIPDAKITTTLKQDFAEVVNLAPAPKEAITVAYRDALLKTVPHVAAAVELMKQKLSPKEKASDQTPEAKDTISPEEMIDMALAGCRDGLLLAVECEMQKALFEKENLEHHLQTSRDIAKAILNIFPKDNKVYLTLANIEFQAKDYEKMIAWMTLGAKNVKQNSMLLWRLGTVLASTGKVKEARDVLEQLKASDAKKLMILHLQAVLDISDQNWSAAVAKLEKVRPEFISNPIELRKIDTLLADCYGKLGRSDDQREAYVRAASLDRTWGPALIGLARSRAASGQLDEAIKDYQAILNFPTVKPKIRLEYAQILLQSTMKKPEAERNYEVVEDAIQQAAIALPGSFLASILQAELLRVKGEIEKARDQLGSIREQSGKMKQATLQQRKKLLSDAKSLTGPDRVAKLKEAKTLLKTAQMYENQGSVMWAKLAELASQNEDWVAVDKTIQEAEEKLGDTPSVRWLKAQKLLQKKDKDVAVALHALAENTDAFDQAEKLNLFRHFANLAILLEDIPQAEKLAKEVLSAEPGDVEMQKVLFNVARLRKNLDAMESVLAKMQKPNGKSSAFWHYGEALRLYMLAKETNDPKLTKEAVKLLSKASKMEPSWPAPTLLLSQIYRDQGKVEQMIRLYKKAIRNGMRDPAIIRNVASLLTQQQRYQEADEMFNLLAQTPGDNMQGLNRSASYVKARLGDFTQSISMARKACANSNDYKDFLWLGHVLEVSARKAEKENRSDDFKKLYGETEQAFLKAIELENSKTDAWIGLMRFYGLFDKKEKFIKAVKQAKVAMPAKEADLALAQSYESLGEVKKAAVHYRKAIRVTPKDANVAEIATLFFLKNDFLDEGRIILKRIMDKQVDASDQQVSWAKRMFGILLAREEKSGDITETIKLLDENLKANPNSILDLYVKASLFAEDCTGIHYAEAIKLFEQAKTLQSNQGVAILQKLAYLYYDNKQLDDYKATMQKVLRQAGDQPQIIWIHIARLSEIGDFDEAKTWLNQLKAIAPDDLQTFLLECDLAFNQKQYDALLEMFNVWAKKKNDKVSLKNRLNKAATLIQKYALTLRDESHADLAQEFEKQAERFMLKLVELEPKAELDLAVLYAQQNKFNKTTLVLNQVADKVGPAQFGLVVYKVLTNGDFPKSQTVQIQRILKRVSDAHPDEVFTKIILAFCEEQLGRPNQAESILRTVLSKKPESVDAMNYLAVTLAFQRKNLEEARELIEKAIKIAGPIPNLLDSRALVSLAQDRPQAAINDLRRAIAKQPSASFYFHLAEALSKGGMRKPAMNVLKKAEKLGLRKENLSPTERRNYQRLKRNRQ